MIVGPVAAADADVLAAVAVCLAKIVAGKRERKKVAILQHMFQERAIGLEISILFTCSGAIRLPNVNLHGRLLIEKNLVIRHVYEIISFSSSSLLARPKSLPYSLSLSPPPGHRSTFFVLQKPLTVSSSSSLPFFAAADAYANTTTTQFREQRKPS